MTLADRLVRGERPNAAIAWTLLALVVVLAVLLAMDGNLLWTALAVVGVSIVVAPAASTRNWTAMVPWPVVSLFALAMSLRTLEFYVEVAGYLAVVGLALAAVVEIDASTAVEMSRGFAVFFAVLTTMAVQSWWTIAQYYSDMWLETTYLTSQSELQWDLFAVTVVGLVVGGLFQWYFERFEHVGSHRRPHIGEEP